MTPVQDAVPVAKQPQQLSLQVSSGPEQELCRLTTVSIAEPLVSISTTVGAPSVNVSQTSRPVASHAEVPSVVARIVEPFVVDGTATTVAALQASFGGATRAIEPE